MAIFGSDQVSIKVENFAKRAEQPHTFSAGEMLVLARFRVAETSSGAVLEKRLCCIFRNTFTTHEKIVPANRGSIHQMSHDVGPTMKLEIAHGAMRGIDTIVKSIPRAMADAVVAAQLLLSGAGVRAF